MALDESLARRLREAETDELLRLAREHVGELDVSAVRHILANPFASREVVELVLGQQRLMTAYEVQRLLAAHRHTPEAPAMRLVAGLYWRDLVRLGRDPKVRPVVRRAAERHLANRLPGLAVGEKMAIARQGGPSTIAVLRSEPEPRVMQAMLENPRLTEGSLIALVGAESAVPEVLAVVARNQRWGRRYPVRVALCRNPRTPDVEALGLLPMLKKNDLKAVASDPRLPATRRRRADLLLGRV